ncbi:MAG TPA: AraC family transcriptional regulator [Alphaproteobacteria bacterium]|nr:AraC family transcriptional regulator [Alphaproteobacteria bacterium]
MPNYALTFSLIEWLAITGLVQCVLILVYILFRVRNWRQAFIPILYFFFLAAAFGFQFALRLEDYAPVIRSALWLCWAMGPPLCYLLVLQVVRLVDMPPARHFLVLLTIPAAVAAAAVAVSFTGGCKPALVACANFHDMLYWAGSTAGALALLPLWARKNSFGELWRARGGRERYWLVMLLLGANLAGLVINFLRSAEQIAPREADALLVTLGIAFAYLATTTLFRVYPPPVALNRAPRTRLLALSEEERAVAEKIRVLMEMDKVYQEHTFSRADLAREVGVSESALSKVVNAAFGRSLPKLLNEYRVEDAKRMLADSSIPIQVIASDAGFNSLASFNRVFRDITGETPSAWRQEHTAK